MEYIGTYKINGPSNIIASYQGEPKYFFDAENDDEARDLGLRHCGTILDKIEDRIFNKEGAMSAPSDLSLEVFLVGLHKLEKIPHQ